MVLLRIHRLSLVFSIVYNSLAAPNLLLAGGGSQVTRYD